MNKKQNIQHLEIVFSVILVILVSIYFCYSQKSIGIIERFNQYKIFNMYENNDTNENTHNKKIALCFLIYDKINNEQLWYDWLKNVDTQKYTIYIHYKNNKPLKYFEKYKLKDTIETSWGDISVVLAQILILKKALTDANNMHFIWLSQSCIPLKSFEYTYNYLKLDKSYFNISPDEQVFPRANKCLKYIKKSKIKKHNMASIINRKHSELFVKNENNIKKWFKDIKNVDEIALLTVIYKNNLENELVLTPNIAAGSIIFAQWSDMSNYKLFSQSNKINDYTYKYICPEELDYLLNSNSLFGRKFEDKCGGLDQLNDKLLYLNK